MYSDLIECHPRNLNKRVSLDLIRFTPGGITRAELARRMGITRSAVTTIINDLMHLELVCETENGLATGGRRAILLELNPRRGYLVGVDIGASHVGVLVTDFSCRVVYEEEKPFDIHIGPRLGLQQIDACLREVLFNAGLDMRHVLGIGVGVPGPVVAEKGIVSHPPIMPGWGDFPIQSALGEMWNCTISLNNDAELGGLGEWAHGAGRRERHLAYIKVGSGIGAGLLLDGKVYRGATGSAGEIGHTTVVQNGPLCSCGSSGCLEAMAGGAAISRQAQEAVWAGKRTILAAHEPLQSITARDVSAAAHLGDLVAQQIIQDAGTYLGIAIASLVNLFNPNLVVVGGGVAQVGDLLLQPIRQVVQQRSLRSSAQGLRINTAVLGRRASSMGAVVQALNTVLDQWTHN